MSSFSLPYLCSRAQGQCNFSAPGSRFCHDSHPSELECSLNIGDIPPNSCNFMFTNDSFVCQQKLLVPRKPDGSPCKPAVIVTPGNKMDGKLPLLKPRVGGLSPTTSPLVRSTNKPLSHPLLGRGRGRGGFRGRGRGNITL